MAAPVASEPLRPAHVAKEWKWKEAGRRRWGGGEVGRRGGEEVGRRGGGWEG